MPRHHYEKCNKEANFGFLDLIHRVLSDEGKPMLSADIFKAAERDGYLDLLYANRPMPKTPWATLYARLSDESKKSNGLVTRKYSDLHRAYLYKLVKGRTPRSGRKLDYSTKNVYVYALVDSITEVPFYVGMGVGQRKNVHLNGDSHSTIVNEVVTHIRSLGRTPVAKVLEQDMDRPTARRYEAAYIATYGRRGVDKVGVLFNQKA